MKAIVIARHGPPEVLQLRHIPTPEPGPNDLLIHNHFIGVNFVDTRHRAGLFYPVTLPLIPGIEAAGIVVEAGSRVTDFRAGDRVAYAGYMGGAYAEWTCVPQERLVPVPSALSLEQAAAVLQQGLTASVLARQVYPLQAGEYALIYAAAGGVGSLLVQTARRLGAVVIGLTSSPQKVPLVKQAGADHVIVSTQTDVVEATMQITDQQGVHVVYDGVGSALYEQSLSVLRTRGMLVAFGLTESSPAPLDISRLSGITGSNNRGSLFVTWASVNDYITTAEQRRAGATALFEAVLQGQIRPHITEVFSLEEAAQAHHLLEKRASTGKLLLQVV